MALLTEVPCNSLLFFKKFIGMPGEKIRFQGIY